MKIDYGLFTASNKSKTWAERVAKHIVSRSSGDDKEKTLICHAYYHGDINQGDYDYLRKIGDYELPARVRFIPIVRQNINTLVSQEARRGFHFRPYVVDEESVNKKLNKKAKDLVALVDNKIEMQLVQEQASLKKLETKKEQLRQIIGRQPQSEEEAKQIEALKEIMPIIEAEIEANKHAIENSVTVTQDELDEVESYYRQNPSDIIEEKATALLKYAANDTGIDIRRQINNGFETRCVDGHELYYVDHLPDHKLPIFRKLDEYNVYWGGDTDAEWVQDGQWVAIHWNMDPSALVDYLGDEIDRETLENLSNYIHGLDYKNMSWNKGSGKVYTNPARELYKGSRINQGVEVWHIIWKAERKIRVKFTPNPYVPGKYFKHFYDDDEKITVNKNKGEFVRTRWINDLYEAYVIGKDKVIKAGKREFQLRDPDTLEVKLPVIGETFAGMKRPYSLIWITRDIQELSNLLHYHRELMFALAGVKGIVMDYTQKPDEFTDKEWLYMRKQGLTLIDSLKKKNGRFATFNQFQAYDDTVGPSVQYIDAMLQSLQRLVDEITGVSYQRKGQVAATDQVGTNQMAIQMSTLTTEILYYQHDETVRRALEMWLNLAKVSVDEQDLTLSFIESGDLSMLSIPQQLFGNASFRIGVMSSSKDEERLRELQQISMQAYARGQVTLDSLLHTYRIDNLKELERKVFYYADKAAKANAIAEQNRMQAELEMEKQKSEFQNEYKLIIAKQEDELKKMELQLKEMELQLKERDMNVKAALEKESNDIKKMDIIAEQQSEMGYLAEQQRAAKTDEMLRMIQLLIDAYVNDKKIDADLQAKLSTIQFPKPRKAGKEQIKR